MNDDFYEHRTKENTHFAEWWFSMHKAGLTLGAKRATYDEAHTYYDAVMTPGDAARAFAGDQPPDPLPQEK